MIIEEEFVAIKVSTAPAAVVVVVVVVVVEAGA